MGDNQWIKVEDRLPDPSSDERYYVTNGSDIAWCYFGCDDEGCEHNDFIGGDCYGSMYESITHWMPVPEVPNETI